MRFEPKHDDRGEFFVVSCRDGQTFTIDAADLKILGSYSWHVMVSRGYERCKYVARSKGQSGTILLHREIMMARPGITIDHADWNGLNNRRYNLREATTLQNHSHVHPDSPRSGRTAASGKRGVYQTSTGRWYSTISLNGRLRYLGRFDDADAAARAWDAVASEARKEFAVLNGGSP